MSILSVNHYKGVELKGCRETSEINLKDLLLNKVLEANNINVPQELIDDEAEMMVQDLYSKARYENMATGGDSIFTLEEQAKQMDEIRAEAFKQVKTRLLLKGIIEAESLNVTREELEEEALAISDRQKMPIEMVKSFLGEDLELLADDLLIKKAIDFIYVHSVIK